MLTLAYFSWTGSLIPGALFLGYSLFCHEGEWVWPKLFKRSAEATAKIQNSFVHVGYLFILAFLYEFCTVYTQTQPLWHNISIRLVVEALALMTFAYWMAFPPASRNKGSWADLAIHSLTEITRALSVIDTYHQVSGHEVVLVLEELRMVVPMKMN